MTTAAEFAERGHNVFAVGYVTDEQIAGHDKFTVPLADMQAQSGMKTGEPLERPFDVVLVAVFVPPGQGEATRDHIDQHGFEVTQAEQEPRA